MGRVTGKQFQALRDFIAVSKDVGKEGKKVILYLLDMTRCLSRPVRMSIPTEYEVWGETAVNGIHGMNSSWGSSHIYLFLKGMGSKFRFDGTWDKVFAVYISEEPYDQTALLIPFNKEEVEKVELDQALK